MEQEIRHILPADYVTTEWSGGTTTQVAIGPEGAQYAGRDFAWRISSARVELEESDFTALPDYDRWISVLDGEMRLRHDGGDELTLCPNSIHAFDGGVATHSKGRCTDFNLMLRKGRCTGQLCSLHLGEQSAVRLPLAPVPAGATETVVVYCVQGEGVLTGKAGSCAFRAGETVRTADSAAAVLQSDQTATFMIAQIFEQEKAIPNKP